VLCGLSGPFCLFLAPVAAWLVWRDRSRTRWWRAGILLACCLVQGSLIVGAHTARGTVPLGAGPRRLATIVSLQIILGALLGRHSLPHYMGLSMWRNGLVPSVIALASLILAVLAFRRGPNILRWAMVAATLLFAAALRAPAIGGDELAWVALSIPDVGCRYYLLPMLVWVGVLFTLAADRNLWLRGIGCALLLLMLVHLPGDWRFGTQFPIGGRTNFAEVAHAFAAAPAGTRMEFPIHPEGANAMVLIKQ
jgi:hypothetical protein